MTILRTDLEERQLESDQYLRAVSVGVPEPERKPDEDRDEYHARIWAAVRAAARN